MLIDKTSPIGDVPGSKTSPAGDAAELSDTNATPTGTPRKGSSASPLGDAKVPIHLQDDAEPDKWELQGKMLIRHINQPRQTLFSPMESADDCSMPLKYVDVWRQTYTNSDMKHVQSILDVWVGDDTDNAELSEPWVGTTKFYLLEKPPRPGWMWSCGREAKRQTNTSRPDYMWVEDWSEISRNPKLKQEILKEWKEVFKPRVSLSRQNRQIKSHVRAEDLEDYTQS